MELKGARTSCKIFNDNVEQTAISQVYEFLNHPAFSGKKTRFMPDIHAGAGAVIGTTVELGSKVIPNVIGVDIGCGMLSVDIGPKEIDLILLDEYITNNIPCGFKANESVQDYETSLKESVVNICAMIGIESNKSLMSVGSLGGGNHFIELGKDERGHVWVTIHSGSRNFGLQVAKYYQKIASSKKEAKADLSKIPPEERERYKKITKGKGYKVPKGMEYLEGEDLEEYLGCMKVAQEYASTSREIMIDKIVGFLGSQYLEIIESVHNYIDIENGIIRKGAISADLGEKVIIPWNMRDGLIIGLGKGNPDWNFSAPHGAGRNMSRSKAKEMIGIEEFEESMKGIYSSSVCKSTIDESPMAYKDYKEIEGYLEETVEIIHRVKPIYNFKAK